MNDLLIEKRRIRVAELRLQGLTMEAICVALADDPKDPIINPDTGNPYTKRTIKSDIDAIKAEWRDEYIQNMETHAAQQRAEIQMVKQMGFSDKNGELILKAVALEMKLLGTAANKEINVNFNIELVNQLIVALQTSGRNPDNIFKKMIYRLKEPDDTE